MTTLWATSASGAFFWDALYR